VPGIHYGVGCDHLLESMLAAGPRILGLDWRTTITDARARMGADLIVQGNLDPVLLLAGTDVALEGTDRVLADNATPDGERHPGHIFNLGHGVHPPTDPDVLTAVAARVHERTSR
jgi:uroporphyrinogen decarboxylase